MKKRFFVLGIAVIVLSAVIITVITFINNNKEDTSPVSGISASVNQTGRPDMVPVYLYFANGDKDGLAAEIRYIPIEEAARSTANLATVILNELIKGPSSSSELVAVIPQDSKILNSVEVINDQAVVNFNASFVENHPGGKTNEQLTIFSIVNTLTELKDINSVVFKVEGELREEYMGNYKFDNPFPRTAALIK